MSQMVYKLRTAGSFSVGDYALFAKTLSATDDALYAGTCGDFSALYMDETFAEKTRFRGRTIHPMLVAALSGGAICRLLGPNSYCAKREFEFLLPVYAEDTITAIAEVAEVDEAEKRLTVSLSCYNQREECVAKGVSSELLTLFEEEERQ